MTTKIDNVSKLPIEFWDADKVLDYPKNAKKHSPEQIDKLARSILRLGLANPIHIEPDGTIIAGHGRKQALLKLGRKTLPVVVRHDLTKAEADALRIQENTTASTDYDKDLLIEAHVEVIRLDEELARDIFDEEELKLGEDMGVMEDVFVEDIGAAVEEQKTENRKAEAEVDSSAAPVTDALGFKRVTIEQSRVVREFMNHIEEETGKKGAEALVEFIRSNGYGGH